MTNSPELPAMSNPLGCDEVLAQLPAYADGRLTGPASWQVEQHAAHCDACGEHLMHITDTLPSRDLLLARLAPTADELATMRAQVLRTDARPSRTAPRATSRWMFGAGLAAAVLAAVVLRPWWASDVRGTPDTVAGNAVPFVEPAAAPMATAMRLATTQAAPEFVALDAATSEIDAALVDAPDDPELRAFRSTLDARRDELMQRIRSVSE